MRVYRSTGASDDGSTFEVAPDDAHPDDVWELYQLSLRTASQFYHILTRMREEAGE